MKKFLHASALTLVVLACGCVSPVVYQAIDRGIAANKGHMDDPAAPQGAQEVGQDNYDLLNELKFNLNGTKMPADTQTRYDVRMAKKAAAEKAKADAAGGAQ